VGSAHLPLPDRIGLLVEECERLRQQLALVSRSASQPLESLLAGLDDDPLWQLRLIADELESLGREREAACWRWLHRMKRKPEVWFQGDQARRNWHKGLMHVAYFLPDSICPPEHNGEWGFPTIRTAYEAVIQLMIETNFNCEETP
jgi:hypothetical protein